MNLSSLISGNPRGLLVSVLMHLGRYIPDELYIKAIYWLHTGIILNLKSPKTFQEKIQWLKLHNRRPEYTIMVDKYAVKKLVAETVGKKHVIRTLGIWDNVEDIDFDKLPEKFVIKTTFGGGGEGIIICKDRSTFDSNSARNKLKSLLKFDIYKNYREWPYKNVPRRIIAEEYLEIPGKTDLTDYKIFCFHGKPKFIQVIQDRHTKETIDFFDTEWNHQPFVGLNPKCKNANVIPKKPQKLEEMIDIARKLSQDIPFVRVDLYCIDSKVYFGELTFYPASGFGSFNPIEWSTKLGEMLELI